MSTSSISNSKSATTFVCRNCGAALQLTNVSDGQSISCSSCGFISTPEIGRQSHHDGRAKLALILGLLSTIFGLFTGIPATIIGIKALKRIRRGEASEKGTQFARVGVAIGATSTVATIMLIFSVVAVIVVAINYSSQEKNAELIQRQLSKMIDAPKIDLVEPRTAINGMELMRVVTLSRPDEKQDDLKVTFFQIRKGLFVLSNEMFDNIIRDQFKNRTRELQSEVFYISNHVDSFNVIVQTGQSSNGRRQKQFIANVPLKNYSVMVEIRMAEIEEADGQNESQDQTGDGLQEETKPKYLMSDIEVLEYFKRIRDPVST